MSPLISRRPFMQHVAALASGTALGQVIVVLVTPLLTRLYSPADMGAFGLLLSFLAVATVAVTLRLDFAIATTSDESKATRLLLACLLLTPMTSVAMSGLFAVLVDREWLSYGQLPLWSAAPIGVALVLTGWFMSLRFWHVSRQDFRSVGRSLVMQGIGRAGASVAFGFGGLDWLGLAAGELAGRALGIRSLWRRARVVVVHEFSAVGLRGVLLSVRSASSYVSVVLPSSLINAVAAALPLPVISILFGTESAGQFALVWRVASVPGALVSASVADVFHAHATWARGDPNGDLPGLLRRTVRQLAWLSTLIYVPSCLLAPLVFGWIFGAAWRPAGMLMLLLLPLWWCSMVTSPVSRLPIVLGRPALKLAYDVAFLVLPLGALIGFSSQGLEVAVTAYGIAASIAVLGFLALMLRLSRSVPAFPCA